MISISVNKLSLSFGITEIFKDISFALNEGDRLGIIGVNGCGKSSLFKLITGEYTPTDGSIFISKDKSVGTLRQDGTFADLSEISEDLTALEVMYLSFADLIEIEEKLQRIENILSSGRFEPGRDESSYATEYAALNEKFIREGGLEFRGRCLSTLSKMGFDEITLNLPFKLLSGGQRTRLALSKELCREPDILLLDEPTNHLDIETLSWLENFLASYKKTLLVISHDRYFLDRVTNKTLLIENKRGALYNGGYTASMKQREIDREIAERHYKNQQKEIARQEAYIAQQRAWNRERNIIAAESRQKMLDKMTVLERPKEAPRPIKINFSSSISSGNDVLTVKDLSFAYNPSKPLISSLSFQVKKNDRLFIVGPNGCGKSTLINLMIGRLLPTGGYIESGYNVNVGYYDQENQNLTMTNTVLDELWNAYPTLPELKIRNTLAMFRFFGEDVFKSVSMLSGGERARLTLAKLILSQMNLLILDEPTNHLDIDSREALEAALDGFDGTVITVSHDRYFLSKLATRIIDMTASPASSYADIHITDLGGAYDELCRDRERRESIKSSDRTESAAKPEQSQSTPSNKDIYLKNKQDLADQRKRARKIERLEAEAKNIEAELEKIDAEMMGEAATDYLRVAELDTKKSELEERLLEIYEELDI